MTQIIRGVTRSGVSLILLIMTTMLSANSSFAAVPKRRSLQTTNSESFSEIARRSGLRFLMIKLSQKEFAILMRESGGNLERVVFPNADHDFLVKEDITLDHSLIPLYELYSGHWAHQLIRDGSDNIGMGMRTVSAKDWKIGVVFPVELLDGKDFQIDPNQYLDTGALVTPPKNRWSPRDREDWGHLPTFLERFNQHQVWPGSYDATPPFTITGKFKVPLMQGAFLWIPAPLLLAIKAQYPKFTYRIPGASSPLIDKTNFKVKVQISTQDPNSERGWKKTVPPAENHSNMFDPKKLIGTWFNTIPNWKSMDATTRKCKRCDLILGGDDLFAPPKTMLTY